MNAFYFFSLVLFSQFLNNSTWMSVYSGTVISFY